MKIRNLRTILILSVMAMSSFAANAQTFKVTGTVVDSTDRSPIMGAYIRLTSTRDTTVQKIVATDVDGKFVFSDIEPQNYRLRGTFLSYADYNRSVRVATGDVNLGNLLFSQDSKLLKEVKVEGQAFISTQKGDTTQFNAAAFKVNADATSEDLVSKMPGITVQNGTVTAQGETVRRVLVDGKQFFGDDATMALRNLPAEIVDKIEVFDRQSDQSQFSGFDDGNAQKTINIVTRQDRNRGKFGKIYGGFGTDNHYNAGGNVNIFGKNDRISLLAMSNNINIQNFSTQDLAGVMSGGGGGGGRGGGGGNNFSVGQQSGISNTTAFGGNYSGTWWKKVESNVSYFFNRTNTNNNSNSFRETFLKNGSQYYNAYTISDNLNLNNRINGRFEYTLDKNNSFIYTPSFNWQNNRSNTGQEGLTLILSDSLNATKYDRSRKTQAFNIGNSLLYRHAFAKRGRTVSINLSANNTQNDGKGTLRNSLRYWIDGTYAHERDSLINQLSQSAVQGSTYSTQINYTEPVGKTGQLQLGYNLNVNNNNSNSMTYNDIDGSLTYSKIDSVLSNNFDNKYVTHRGGLSYRIRNASGLMFNMGVDLQSAGLFSQQLFPGNNKVDQTFTNVLPNLMLMYRNNKTGINWRVFYRSSTQQPSINQLQNVVNNSNPLFLTAGNPELKQQLGHNISARFSKSNINTGSNFFATINATLTNNLITNATIIATETPIIISDRITLAQGSQLTMPVNIKSGSQNYSAFLNYGFPIKPIKVNLNINAGGSYRKTPGLINDLRNISNTFTYMQGIVLSSNISSKLDFTLAFNGNWNFVDNTIQTKSNNRYFTQNSSGRINWTFGKNFILSTDATYSTYSGLGEGYNQKFTLWNASFGKKFLKKNAGELKLTVFDILKQNQSISRTVTETYQLDATSRVLTQYAMLTFTYTLRSFGVQQNNNNNGERWPRGEGGGFQRGGGGFPGGGFPGGGRPGGF